MISPTSVPRPLSSADAAHYRDIFRLQDAARWKAADKVMAALGDKLLLGEVEAQRYLSAHYHTSYDQLRQWLARYGGEPGAGRLYRLALIRRPAGAPAPAHPGNGAVKADGGNQLAVAASYSLARAESDGILVAHHRRPYAPTRDWNDGLRDWQKGRLLQAGRDFQALAKSRGHSPDLIAAAAFWAARVELRRGRPELYNFWLGLAAEHPRTFYGLLACRTLGLDTYIDFDPIGFTALDAKMFTSVPAGRRVLALLEIGQRDRAEAELRVLARHASPNLLEASQALADQSDLPSLGDRVEARLRQIDGNAHRDRKRFPVPRWKPRGGFAVDRALIYGLMRQESKFHPDSHSYAGATGLMQLMPETAREVARRSGVKLGRRGHRLTNPATNIALAQRYIIELMSDPRVNGNLLYFAAAYNRGPGALAEIKARSHAHGDPLLFLETIRNHGTREFIEKVLTNYWIYRLRLGQPTPDLEALAAGEWPIYTAEDDSSEPLVRNAEN
ncbi:MAG: lytic transglycosylase domain-containing protein [Stellaceae bacterium]